MEVKLSADIEQYIAEKIRAGEYPDASAVISAGIETMRLCEDGASVELARLRADVAVAIDQLDRGMGTSWNLEEMKARARQAFAARRR